MPMLLQRGNTGPLTCAATSSAVESIMFQVVQHSSYSPDWALSDFEIVCSSQETSQINLFQLQ